MSKGRYEKKTSARVPVWLIAGIALVVLAAGVYLIGGWINHQREKENMVMINGILQPKPVETSGSDIPQSSDPANSAEGPTVPTENPAPDTQPGETDMPEETQEPEETRTPYVEATHPTVVIVQRAEAEYEKWLCASLIVCVSMEYPDFQLEGVYAASATAMEDKFDSDGAYILFTSGGTRMAIHARALEKERTEPGTMDISTEAIGFATFDQVDPDGLALSSMEQIAVEDLGELISQSILVSIYTH